MIWITNENILKRMSFITFWDVWGRIIIFKPYGKIKIWQLITEMLLKLICQNKSRSFLSLLHFVLWDLLPTLAAVGGVPVCQQWYQGGSVFRLITALRTWLWSLTYLISFGWLLFTEIHSGLWLVFIFCLLFFTSWHIVCIEETKAPLVEYCSRTFFF